GDEKRPWECCDIAMCTRSIPPICRCVDKVDRCSDACKDCEETEDNRHVCFDTYIGDPGPTCHDD
uniref:Bowman-Birk type trypsin inhibitor TI1 n=1 Tax=Coix lacryma-jobi TaxID=4505 RepID=IBB1_COILA|nr:RecName: Full=Bowman-Birk type trypsin inhibitor TI1 [Coix lacryma-jobi]